MEYSRNQRILWALGTVVVLFYALIPVVWIISLSLKEPTTIGDQKFFPPKCTFDNYDSVFEAGLGFNRALFNSIGIAIITTLLALALASMAAYAITRLEFPGKTLILAARSRSRCSRRSRSSAVCSTSGARRPLRHLARADPAVPVVRAAAVDLHAVGVLQRDPVGSRESGADGRRDRHAGVPEGHPAARNAGRVHRRHPRLHRRVERLPVRERADGDRRRTHRSGGAVVLPRRLAVHRTRPAPSRPARWS